MIGSDTSGMNGYKYNNNIGGNQVIYPIIVLKINVLDMYYTTC